MATAVILPLITVCIRGTAFLLDTAFILSTVFMLSITVQGCSSVLLETGSFLLERIGMFSALLYNDGICLYLGLIGLLTAQTCLQILKIGKRAERSGGFITHRKSFPKGKSPTCLTPGYRLK